ncbi:MAG: hypothetical protein M3326_08695 [Actinomycetota bacterium]|nr:hypothetical protein [Actinomycetota bacterium]
MNRREVAAKLRALATWIRRTPATHILLLILVVTTLLLRGLDEQMATHVLRTASTNLVHMARDAPRVLFLSAFLVDGNVIVELLKVELVLAPFERFLGTARLLAVFVAGHVGATLVTTIGIWWQVHTGAGTRDLVYPVDVGISYGLFACAGVLATNIPNRVAAAVASTGLAAFVTVAIVGSGTFTDWGHAAALGIGFALAPLVSRHREPTDTPAFRRRYRPAALAASAVLVVVATVFGVAAALAGRPSTAQPAAAPAVSGRIVGRLPGCSTSCSQAVVDVDRTGAPDLRTVRIPSRVAVLHGERIPVPPGSTSVDVAGRTDLQGLFAATSSMVAAIAVAVLVVALRRGRRADAPVEEATSA